MTRNSVEDVIHRAMLEAADNLIEEVLNMTAEELTHYEYADVRVRLVKAHGRIK